MACRDACYERDLIRGARGLGGMCTTKLDGTVVRDAARRSRMKGGSSVYMHSQMDRWVVSPHITSRTVGRSDRATLRHISRRVSFHLAAYHTHCFSTRATRNAAATLPYLARAALLAYARNCRRTCALEIGDDCLSCADHNLTARAFVLSHMLERALQIGFQWENVAIFSFGLLRA